jgi:hypothetical protein
MEDNLLITVKRIVSAAFQLKIAANVRHNPDFDVLLTLSYCRIDFCILYFHTSASLS